VYGDLHGCLAEFKTLRAKINPSKNDREIVIGDILDRGPSSNELLAYIRKHSIESILGNHEYKYIRYQKHYEKFLQTSKKIPMKLTSTEAKIFETLTDEDFNYLNSLPYFIKIDNLTLLHAGITNKINLDKIDKDDLSKLLWIRTLDKNQKILSLKDDKDDAKHWSEYYNGNQGIIVYGHQAFKDVKINKYSLGIDTGCVYGNKLTAVIIENTINPLSDYELVSVPSKQKRDKQYELR